MDLSHQEVRQILIRILKDRVLIILSAQKILMVSIPDMIPIIEELLPQANYYLRINKELLRF